MEQYLGEAERTRELTDEEVHELEFWRDLEERGYVLTRVSGYIPSGRSTVLSGSRFDGAPLLHHIPCGQAIFDPDVHDPLCPARDDREERPCS